MEVTALTEAAAVTPTEAMARTLSATVALVKAATARCHR